ncbi:MAG: PD40 domain-containing protein [Deltaproteobacteria bacterium]|nr:PD40 domain-containing protein [Deltaproteobacteria bacterium]
MRKLTRLIKYSLCNKIIVITVILFVMVLSAEGAEVKEMRGKIVFSTIESARSIFNIIYLDKKDTWKNPVRFTLPHKGDRAHSLVWLPDGKNILFHYSEWSSGVRKEYLATINEDNHRVTPFEFHKIILPDNYKRDYACPKLSPDGSLLGAVAYGKRGVQILVYNYSTKNLTICDKVSHCAPRFSWSPDSKYIAFETYEGPGEIAVWELESNNIRILDKGRNPIFNPLDKSIYYIGLDKHLYAIGIDGSRRHRVDNRDWSWTFPIGFSKDGQYLFFTDGVTHLWEALGGLERQAIFVFDLNSHKKKRISKRYPIIEGLSLFED